MGKLEPIRLGTVVRRKREDNGQGNKRMTDRARSRGLVASKLRDNRSGLSRVGRVWRGWGVGQNWEN